MCVRQNECEREYEKVCERVRVWECERVCERVRVRESMRKSVCERVWEKECERVRVWVCERDCEKVWERCVCERVCVRENECERVWERECESKNVREYEKESMCERQFVWDCVCKREWVWERECESVCVRENECESMRKSMKEWDCVRESVWKSVRDCEKECECVRERVWKKMSVKEYEKECERVWECVRESVWRREWECVREWERGCVYCREVWVRLSYLGRGIRVVREGALKFKLRVWRAKNRGGKLQRNWLKQKLERDTEARSGRVFSAEQGSSGVSEQALARCLQQEYTDGHLLLGRPPWLQCRGWQGTGIRNQRNPGRLWQWSKQSGKTLREGLFVRSWTSRHRETHGLLVWLDTHGLLFLPSS